MKFVDGRFWCQLVTLKKKTEKVETIDIEVGQTSPFLEVRRTYTDVMSDYEEEQTTPLRDLVWQDRLLRPSTLLF